MEWIPNFVSHNKDVIQILVSMVALSFSGVGLIMTAIAIIRQTKSSRLQKQVDVIIECNRRYDSATVRIRKFAEKIDNDVDHDSLIINSLKIGKADKLKAESAFRAYWLVYYEEWQYFRIGMVPLHYYNFWCKGLIRNFLNSAMEGFYKIDLKQNWHDYGASSWGYTGDFYDHIQMLILISEKEEAEWDTMLENCILSTRLKGKFERKNIGRI